MLHFDGTKNGLDGAGKFNQQAVTHQFYNASVPRRYNWLKETFAMRSDYLQSTGFVIADEAAVANDVGGKYRGEAAFQIPTSKGWKTG
ncbi:hypothetical protein GCM10010973_26240 [Cribrihabitans marinus]|nr:hypothetical protein GCM10010973_26240 [Cribrihabitans marinus]